MAQRFDLNETFFNKKIQSEYQYQINGEQARDSVLNIGDPFIDEAIKYLKSNNDLKSYLGSD